MKGDTSESNWMQINYKQGKMETRVQQSTFPVSDHSLKYFYFEWRMHQKRLKLILLVL